MRLLDEQKNKPQLYSLQETCFKLKDMGRLKVKEWRKIYYANTNPKKAGIAILILERVDFTARKIIVTSQ